MKPVLNKSSFTPLYHQIGDHIRREIESGGLTSGQLVSERELSERFGVSRMTARQALHALREDGLLYSEKGRGTFVAEPALNLHTRHLLGFSEDMRRRGLKPSSRVLSFGRFRPDEALAARLSLGDGMEAFAIERLRLADGEAMAYEKCFVPVRRCPRLKRAEVERGSLYALIEDRYGCQIAWADEILRAAAASGDEARRLSIPPGAPVLVVERTVFGNDDLPVEVVRSVYRGDRYQAAIHLKRRSRK